MCYIPNKFGTVLQFPEPEKCKSNGVIEPITWEMHGRQGEHSNRSQAVEKAMKMKIKKVKPICSSAWQRKYNDYVPQVPWWNKRTRLERRLILTALALVLLVSILIAALVLTVQSFSDVVRKLRRSKSVHMSRAFSQWIISVSINVVIKSFCNVINICKERFLVVLHSWE